jgi:hypothetical protein
MSETLETKINKIHDLCNKLNVIDYKEYCIMNNFKDLEKKYDDFKYIHKLKFSIESEVDELDDIHELIQIIYFTKSSNLKKLATKKGVKLYDTNDINFFIKQYNINPVIIEI